MLLSIFTFALAAPLNPWGSATPKGAALVNPYLYVYADAVNPLVYGSAGLSDHVDVYFGYGEYLPQTGPGVGTLEFFPRFFVIPQLAFAPHVYWTPGVDGVVTAPEVHLNLSAGRVSFIGNVGWRPTIRTSGFDAGSVVTLLAPEVLLADKLSAYLEIDPTVSLDGDPFALTVVPGFGMTLDADGRHTLSAGLQIPVLPTVGPASVGLWYAFLVPATPAG